jgi:hypothetical protein
MMTRVGRLTQFRAELLHLSPELSPIAGPERRQRAVVMHAGAGEVALNANRGLRGAVR